jgi:hypothetical protein
MSTLQLTTTFFSPIKSHPISTIMFNAKTMLDTHIYLLNYGLELGLGKVILNQKNVSTWTDSESPEYVVLGKSPAGKYAIVTPCTEIFSCDYCFRAIIVSQTLFSQISTHLTRNDINYIIEIYVQCRHSKKNTIWRTNRGFLISRVFSIRTNHWWYRNEHNVWSELRTT